MSASLDLQPQQALEETKENLLRRFLQVYWLRPENAFWMTLRSETLAACSFEPPALDLACGDGLFSFLHCGGALDPSFDVFRCVSDIESTALSRKRAPCHTHGHHDMFDRCDEDYQPTVVGLPRTNFRVGLDLKSAMLAKAAKLNFFDNLVKHDCNRPLPFEDGCFCTVYCNAAYWIENISGFLQELRRITHPEGRVILQVKLDAMAHYTLASFRNMLGPRFLEIIGRGRLECWQSLTGRGTWEERFARAGLRIECETPFITAAHAHIWDVGLRPIAPLLTKLANNATEQTRNAVKTEWVELFMELTTPLCDAQFNIFENESEPAEIQYELRPQ